MGYRGRATVRIHLSKLSYSTGSGKVETKITKELRELHERSIKYPNLVVDRNLYNILCDKEIFLLAYQKLRSKPGNMTRGTVPETLDGMSTGTIDNLIEKLKDETFQFSAGRRVQIPKLSNGTRPLTIASPRDKLVQESMRMILEAIWEPLFADNSHGFRPNRSCHTALNMIKAQFQPSVWVIEGDISKCFDSIDHNKLMELIESKIKNRKFTRLIWKSLKAGYFEFKVYSNNFAGTPQGSIISPILSNIFMSLLDNHVNGLKTSFDKGKKTKGSSEYNNLHYLMKKAKETEDMETLMKLAKLKRSISFSNYEDPSFKKLSYVRYADDWVIGVRGTYKETLDILNSVKTYLSSIGLILSDSKTKVTNLNTSKVLFLGTEITRAREYTFVRVNKGVLKRNAKKLRLMAPLKRIVSRLHMANFMKDNISYPKFIWMTLEHRQILHLYNSVLRGILNYYSFVHNYSRLVSRTLFVLKHSCAKLLAAKFSLGTMSKVFNKFGNNLEYEQVNRDKKVKTYSFLKPSYGITLKFLIDCSPIINTLYGSKSIAILDGLECNICNSSENVEMHHVRYLKDLNPKLDKIDELMASRKRKQIPLCRVCHVDKHAKAKRVLGGFQKHQIREYHYKSLKRKGKNIVLYKNKDLRLIPYPQTKNTNKYIDALLNMICVGIIIIFSLVSLMFSEPEETGTIEIIFPNKLEKQDNITNSSPMVDFEVNYETSVDEYEETVEDEREEISLKIYTHNLEAFMKNGLITVYEETEMSSSSGVNTEIVNRIRSGDNVTIYSQSEGEMEVQTEMPQENQTEMSQENHDSPLMSEKEMVKQLIDNINSNRKKVIIVTEPTDNPLPLPSWYEVEARPKNDDPKEWEKWRRNVLIQKAWTSKFPFLVEHYERIPVNQRINAWRNRIENSENVRYFREPIQDIFEQDPNIGEDLRDLFSSEDKKDIFDDDPYIGTDIEKLFKNEEKK